MRYTLFTILVLLSISSCSNQYYCPNKSEKEAKESKDISIGKVELKAEKLIVEITNTGAFLLYLPDELVLNCKEDGRCFMDNDVFVTSMSIPIKVKEINPGETATLSCSLKSGTRYNTIELDLHYAITSKKIMVGSEFSNINLIEHSNDNIQQIESSLIKCKR